MGWELHAPTEQLGVLYEALWEAGQDLGVANVGNHALDSLRMEKQYMISRDLTHDAGPDEAGLHRFVKPEKGSFVGREALMNRRAQAETGHVQTGAGFRMLQVVENVEELTGAPVVASDIALYWAMLAELGLSASPGYGTLLSMLT